MSNEQDAPMVADHVLRAIDRTLGPLQAERGGVLGQDRETGAIDDYHFDVAAARTTATYSPDTAALGRLFEAWDRSHVRLAGFVHSHPPGMTRPSSGDVDYGRRILAHNPKLTALEIPIAQSAADTGRFDIAWWRLMRDNGSDVRLVHALPIVISSKATPPASPMRNEKVDPMFPRVRITLPQPLWLADGTFARVEGAYDLARLATARVIVVGVGGAASFVEDLARAGVGEFVIVDPDFVSLSNLATQQTYREGIGRPKVEALARRIHDINPDCIVKCIQKPVEAISDSQFRRFAFGYSRIHEKLPTTIEVGARGVHLQTDLRMRPSVTLLMGMTDDFYAQARVARLALQLGLPCLLAQVYQEGRGLELVFSYPGVTPACPRCLLKPRYDAYLNDGFQNNVTSHGTPIFATARLNAIKGFIAMALLHYGSDHSRWGPMLERIAHRNLIQVRCDPDLELRTFERAFSGASREMLFFDESVFVPRKPVRDCPDCGGSGDLRNMAGRIPDTRLIG